MSARSLYSYLAVALSLSALGCSSNQVQQVSFQVSDIQPGYCKAVSAQPGYFWEKPQRVMPCRTDRGQLVFIDQQYRQDEDLMAELTGPLATVTQHLMIPITPIP
jgi:hypothetical protein